MCNVYLCNARTRNTMDHPYNEIETRVNAGTFSLRRISDAKKINRRSVRDRVRPAGRVAMRFVKKFFFFFCFTLFAYVVSESGKAFSIKLPMSRLHGFIIHCALPFPGKPARSYCGVSDVLLHCPHSRTGNGFCFCVRFTLRPFTRSN